MAHDRDGKELKAGDTVNVPCVFKGINADGEIVLETELSPEIEVTTIRVNPKQVVKENQ